jgi:osmotically-inducible protein OsmY
MSRPLLVPFLALAVGLAGALACGSDEEVATAPPTAQEAAQRLAEARSEVETLRARLAEAEAAEQGAQAQADQAGEALERAREAHGQARNALRDAEQRLAAAEPPPPSDDEVFRRVQKQLLDAPALARVAIKAEVENRTVTLLGTVPDEPTRDAAIQVARAVEGVADVRSEIRLAE